MPMENFLKSLLQFIIKNNVKKWNFIDAESSRSTLTEYFHKNCCKFDEFRYTLRQTAIENTQQLSEMENKNVRAKSPAIIWLQ